MKSLILETRIKLTFKTLPAQDDGPRVSACRCAGEGSGETAQLPVVSVPCSSAAPVTQWYLRPLLTGNRTCAHQASSWADGGWRASPCCRDQRGVGGRDSPAEEETPQPPPLAMLPCEGERGSAGNQCGQD